MRQQFDRRQFLLKAGGGIGGLALAGLMQQEARAAWPGATDPLAPPGKELPGGGVELYVMGYPPMGP